VAILFVVLEHEYFDVAFGTEKDLLAAIVGFADAIFLQLEGHSEQRVGYVKQIRLGKIVLGHFLLLDGLRQRKIVVVGVGVKFVIFDAEMDF